MTYVWQRWLADEFRAAGLEVVEVEGWKDRGRPASTGHFNPQGPVTVHHTGVTSSAASPGPTLRTLIEGRSDLPGPLCQWSVRHDGVVVVIAAGRANHAGRVGRSGVPGMPLGADGNALALGDEVDTNGIQAMPDAQRRSIAITNAVVLHHNDVDEAYAHRHEDISSTGKWDLGSLTTAQVRADTRIALEEDDMPSPEEIARAVWNADLKAIGGESVRAGRLLVQTHNRSKVAPQLREILDELGDNATAAQVGRANRRLRALIDEIERDDEVTEGGDDTPHV